MRDRTRGVRPTALLAVALVLTGCEATFLKPVPERDGGWHLPAADAAVTIDKVGPQGGTVSALGGRVTLIIPPGALKEDTEITVRTNGGIPEVGRAVGSQGYDLGPDGLRFLQPVTLVIGYDPAALPAGSTGADLAIHRLEGPTWQKLPTQVAPSEASTQLDGFSTYALLGAPSSGGPDGGTPGDPTTLVSNQAGVRDLATDGSAVYWTICSAGAPNGGKVMASSSTGVVKTLASNLTCPEFVAIAYQGSTVFWSDWTEHKVYGIPKGGGAKFEVGSIPTTIGDLAADPAYVYITGQGGVYRMSIGGGPLEKLGTSSASTPGRLVVDADYVFWTTYLSGTVHQVMKNGSGTQIDIASGQSYAYGIAVDSQNVYWCNWNLGGAVMKRSKFGGSYSELVPGSKSPPQTIPAEVASDGQYIYWRNMGGVYGVSVYGGTRTVLGKSHNAASGTPRAPIVVGISYVFWTDDLEQRIAFAKRL